MGLIGKGREEVDGGRGVLPYSVPELRCWGEETSRKGRG